MSGTDANWYPSPIDGSARGVGGGHPTSVDLTRSADRRALESFCRAVHPRLVGALSLRLGGRDVAEELAQDTLSRVVERWDRIRSLDDPEGYTFRIAFNLANSWWRRRRAESRAMGSTRSIVPAASTVDDSDPRPERLRVALTTLSGRQREVIVYRFYLDRSVRETAVAMNCAEGTVRALTAQALAALRSSGIEVDDG